MTLADQYHDEHGRPLAPPAPEPSKTSRETLEAWQRATLTRAAARQERRADHKELGPLHAQGTKTKADRRAQLSAALGVANQPEPETRQSINAAFSPAPPAREPEQPPAAPISAANPPNQRTAAHETAPPAVEPELGPPPPDPSIATERRMANIKAVEDRKDDRSAARRAASLKSAATVRARRAAAEAEKALQNKVNELVVIAQDRWHHAEAIAAEEAAIKAANPGIHTPRELLAYARTCGLELDLYRLAHIARQSHQPAQWSPEFRQNVVTDLHTILAACPKKGTTK
jgi:hypothetical protein